MTYLPSYSLNALRDLEPGAHLACLYETEEEHRAVLASFLGQGLERQERVIYVCGDDPRNFRRLRECLRVEGLEVTSFLACGQLSFVTPSTEPLLGKRFSPDHLIALLRAQTERALAKGYTALRVGGEMAWMLQEKLSTRRLLEFEAELNAYFSVSDNRALCLYRRRRFDPEVLLEVLASHNPVIVGTELCHNCYYLPSPSAAGRNPAENYLHHRLNHLVASERREGEVRLLQKMTQEISGAPDFQAALAIVLTGICRIMARGYGEVWIPSGDESVLECSPTWCCRGNSVQQFRASSEGLTFPPGVGLPGRVWVSKRYEWITDASTEEEALFLRRGMAREAGLRAALGVPIVADDQVLAVLVFFMFESRAEDRRLVNLILSVGAQLGAVLRRKQVEQERSRLAAILEATSDAVGLADPDGVILYMNAACRHLLGFGKDEPLAGVSIPACHPDWAAATVLNEGIPTAVRDGMWKGETALLSRDGQVIPVSQVIMAHRTSRGELEFLSTIARDITEQKHLTDQLQQTVAQLRRLEKVVHR